MADTYKLSKEGLKKLQDELSVLKDDKRPVAVKRLAEARAMGDLSENSEYTAAREDLNFMDGRIAEIEQILDKSEVIDQKKNDNVVQVGDKIVVEVEGSKSSYHIVGEFEADIASGKISDTSPIGKALLGAQVGAKVDVKIPAGNVTYKIVKID